MDGGEKCCPKCKVTKSSNEYSSHKGKLATYCKPCFRLFMKGKDYTRDKEKDKKRKSTRRSTNKALLDNIVKSSQCMDCGTTDYRIMEFDHRDEKRFNIADGVSRYTSVLLSEIEKCDIVCANCHRRRTAITRQWMKLEIQNSIAK